jgi:hypothetical protein
MLFDSHTSSVAVVVGGGWKKVFNSSPRRTVLVFGTDSGQIALFNNRDTGATGAPIVTVGGSSLQTLTYRDFGPIVQGEVWVRASSVNATVSVTEIFQSG